MTIPLTWRFLVQVLIFLIFSVLAVFDAGDHGIALTDVWFWVYAAAFSAWMTKWITS